MPICTNSRVIKIFSKSYIWQCGICCWVCGSHVRVLLNPTVSLLGTCCRRPGEFGAWSPPPVGNEQLHPRLLKAKQPSLCKLPSAGQINVVMGGNPFFNVHFTRLILSSGKYS